jgi:D-beta-D-heptose 7-phosphate kinase/D-beta-D-heptose 1-phosphate adenosyltransferase
MVIADQPGAEGAEARGKAALVVGDVMLDRYIIGDASRLSPEAPVPVVAARDHDRRPGGAANVAAGIAALGVPATLLAVTGEDVPAKELGDLVRQFGVDFQPVTFSHLRTTEKIRVVSGLQQIVRIDYETGVDGPALDELMERYLALLPRHSAVVFSDYNKGVLRRLPEMLAAARRLGIPTFVDPKVADPEHYRGAFLIKPNTKEFNALLGEDGSLNNRARGALDAYDWDHIVVTRSAEGMVHFPKVAQERHYPAEAHEIYDVSGAGDTVLAALTVGYLTGISLPEAIAQANVAASIAVSHAGTYVVSRADFNARLSEQRLGNGKVRDLDSLLQKLGQAKFSGAKVVFTNGCFDILHAGHVRYLNEARRMGDLLVVGLNGDASICRLKGPSRPVNGFEDRAEVLAGLGCVDFVIGFDEDTPALLIEVIKPHVLIKGGDYTIENIVGADTVLALGGKVMTLPLVEGRSTSAIIARAGKGKDTSCASS